METQTQVTPPVDIFENDDELLLVADVPGVTQEKLQVRLERDELTLEGDAGDHVYRRVFTVPQTIDGDKVSAELKHGILRVRLPKAAATRIRQIPINTNNA